MEGRLLVMGRVMADVEVTMVERSPNGRDRAVVHVGARHPEVVHVRLPPDQRSGEDVRDDEEDDRQLPVDHEKARHDDRLHDQLKNELPEQARLASSRLGASDPERIAMNRAVALDRVPKPRVRALGLGIDDDGDVFVSRKVRWCPRLCWSSQRAVG